MATGKWMKVRVNIRCATCGWLTSRAPRADGDYGPCRCGLALKARPPRQPVTPVRSPVCSQFATWPELVAAELERLESGGTDAGTV